MAWRIEESVIRGEIDNRIRGRVTGRIWFAGRTEPLELSLTGDCWRDMAGRLLEFTNPEPKAGEFDHLATLQQGAVGDISASRKVKVPDIPLDQIGEFYAAKKPFPWHWGNSLYLEWFSQCNGRVVIESASYQLKIVGEPAWEMTPEEEESQRRANGAAITSFMEQLNAAMAGEDKAEFTVTSDDITEDEMAAWGEKPQTEEEAAQLQAESDRLVDRIHARLSREGEGADYGKIMEEEIARLRHERGEPEPTPEQLARDEKWVEEMNRAGREAVDDLESSESLDREHPLATKAQELALQVMSETDERGWLTEMDGEEHPVAELVDTLFKASVKFAGALNGRDWPPGIEECAGIIVRLIKARVYLDDALRAMESCQEQKLVDLAWLGVVLVDVIDLAQEADVIICDLRERLKRSAE
jgi:hypothetical protein